MKQFKNLAEASEYLNTAFRRFGEAAKPLMSDINKLTHSKSVETIEIIELRKELKKFIKKQTKELIDLQRIPQILEYERRKTLDKDDVEILVKYIDRVSALETKTNKLEQDAIALKTDVRTKISELSSMSNRLEMMKRELSRMGTLVNISVALSVILAVTVAVLAGKVFGG